MGDESNNHPAYQAILDVIPDSLHSVIIPKLKEWDAGVTRKFQEIHQQYEPLKPFQKFVDHDIDPDYAEQAVIFANAFEQDPRKVVDNVNQTYNLGYVSAEQAAALQQPNEDEDFDFGEGEADLTKHPQFQAMQTALEQMQQRQEQERQQLTQQQELEQFDQYLTELETKVTDPNQEGGAKPFNRLFVTALMQQGLSGEDAVNQYHQVLAGNVTLDTEQDNNHNQTTNNQQTTPPVMGSGGTAGGGVDTNVVNFGELSKNEINDTVEQLLKAAQDSGQ